ncbi:60S ribosomal export protein NMD3 [Bactrocera neohumeralis]|uniref:60S ribosomal export protein NMD3 n=1 Tax=Bactrocera tryoni TaxID=59916 RepID=UPI001A980D64|nr:60S ribosomal export protein NMD3 [Bactrocera tryoni]XP_050330422.1 60S ribosomal export protein NMD3 [Bactrocera neohumeralis]
MEYMEPSSQPTKTTMILCCECGVPIEPNPSNMCVTCLRNHIDITENIPKQAVLHFCRNCERYLQPPGEWVTAALESRELLALCLKKLKGLKAVKLVDAGFVWTEPHSKRIKVKLTVHGEINGGTVLQQVFIVEFTVQNQMCDDCHRTEAKDFWHCLVQVRQRAENKKTFYYLEQLILKHKAHENTLGIKPLHGGLDFYYANFNHAKKMVDFLQYMVPVKVTTSKRLISHDIHSNNFNYKYTWSVEIAPLSKDSAVCLSKKLRQQLGNLSPVCLVYKVATGIHLIDPMTAQISELPGQMFFRNPFEALCDPKQLVEYVVMDIEPIMDKDRKHIPGTGHVSFRHVLCDIWVVRSSELGINENTIHTRSHLGHLLKVGDSVMGYNLGEANLNNTEFENLSADQIPDVLLVRKCYADRQTRSNNRNWKLRHLADEATDERSKHDFHEFLEDLEEDVDYRKQINIYRDAKKALPVDSNDKQAANDSVPHITLAEMLEDLALDCEDDAMGEDNADEGAGAEEL